MTNFLMELGISVIDIIKQRPNAKQIMFLFSELDNVQLFMKINKLESDLQLIQNLFGLIIL